jgi:hypothetical protein
MLAFVMYGVFWVAILDYIVFLFACKWTDLANAHHMYYTDQSKQQPAQPITLV